MFLSLGWRDQVWSGLDQQWDIIIIGGGITGAGLLREACRAGLKTLLVEAEDFSSGTSSRSSKLVHGGFRYLKNAQFKITYESIKERERLLREGRGLVNPMGFLLACYKKDRPPAWVYGIGLILYDLVALKWGHRYYDSYDLLELCPYLRKEGLLGGYRFFDAQADDARLVLRVLFEAINDGGVAINYACVTDFIKKQNGDICGVILADNSGENKIKTQEIQSKVVINASGAWADELRFKISENRTHQDNKLRHLRGSHLVFSRDRLPLTRAICMSHPRDHRFIFAFPWEGVSIIGTTDVDHNLPLATEVSISDTEIEYLLESIQSTFPDLGLKLTDIQSTFSGIRPVIGTGKTDPSKESREHILLLENELLTVTGGKLTTFRLMAHKALNSIRHKLPSHPRHDPKFRVLDEPPREDTLTTQLNPQSRLRMIGRYGADVHNVINCAQNNELSMIGTSPNLWCELRWAARSEGVIHLDDLLLRRIRLGMVQPYAVIEHRELIRKIVLEELKWDETRWQIEFNSLNNKIRQYYLPAL